MLLTRLCQLLKPINDVGLCVTAYFNIRYLHLFVENKIIGKQGNFSVSLSPMLCPKIYQAIKEKLTMNQFI